MTTPSTDPLQIAQDQGVVGLSSLQIKQAKAEERAQFFSIGQAQQRSAMLGLAGMMSGNDALAQEPGVAMALAQSNAHPAEAGEINQFIMGLGAERRMSLASASNTAYNPSAQERDALQSMGINPDATASGQLLAQQKAAAVAAAAAKNATPQSAGHKGLLSQVWGDVEDVAKGAIHYPLKAATEGWNFVADQAGQLLHQDSQAFHYATNPGDTPNPVATQAMDAGDRARDAQAKGYDPNSLLSMAAYSASGKSVTETHDIATGFDQSNPQGLFGFNGQQAMDVIAQYTNNPQGYLTQLAAENKGDPAKIAHTYQLLTSESFRDAALKYQTRNSTPGNVLANGIGLNPADHPHAYAITSAGLNLAASFLIDPTSIALTGLQAARASAIGIKGAADAERMAAILDRANAYGQASRGSKVLQSVVSPIAQVQRGWSTAIRLTHEADAALKGGDEVAAAAKMAQVRAFSPALYGIADDILHYGGTGIHDLADAADYIRAKGGLVRLSSGKAVVESSKFMPGTLSAFGVKRLRSATAGWMSARSAVRTDKAVSATEDALANSPALAQSWRDKGWLTDEEVLHSMPAADDAVGALPGNNTNIVGDTVGAGAPAAIDDVAVKAAHGLQGRLDDLESQHAAGQLDDASYEAEVQLAHQELGPDVLPAVRKELASQTRTAPKLTPAGRGEVEFNLRRYGRVIGQDETGKAVLGGWSRPSAVAARSRLIATRFSSILPRNEVVKLDSANSADKIYKFARLYLGRGEADRMSALWVNGDEGVRRQILQGVTSQVAHAAGLGHTDAGRELIASRIENTERYSNVDGGSGELLGPSGQPMAIHVKQLADEWTIPSLDELRKVSAKIGLWDNVIQRTFQNSAVNEFGKGWKTLTLLRPASITRNQVEGWLNIMTKGQLGDALKTRAYGMTPNSELWAKGLAENSRTEYESLLEAGKVADAEELAKSPHFFAGQHVGRSATMTKVMDTAGKYAGMAMVGKVYRNLMGRTMSEAHVAALEELDPSELQMMMKNMGDALVKQDLGHASLSTELEELSKAKISGVSRMKVATNEALSKAARRQKAVYDAHANWSLTDPTGDLGREAYVRALNRSIDSPDIARSIINTIRDPEKYTNADVVSAVDSHIDQRNITHFGFGKYVWDGDGTARLATTDAEKALGKSQHADAMIADLKTLLTAAPRNGEAKPITELMDFITEHGTSPDADWIQKHIIKTGQMPEKVLAPELSPVIDGGLKGLADTLQDVGGAAYQQLVERRLLRTTTAPAFLSYMVDERVMAEPYLEHLMGQGLSRESALKQVQEYSYRRALQRTEDTIDDPTTRAQFDVISKNLFPFSRATLAMLRRWGGTLYRNPVNARRMMLGYEAAQHSGFIYTNAYGEPTFTYPASGLLQGALNAVGMIPGFRNVSYFPLSSSMTGGVLMAVPGADNPFRVSMGPMLAVPLRETVNILYKAGAIGPGAKGASDAADRFINGNVGAGQTFDSFLPSSVRNVYKAMGPTGRNSSVNSAMVGAVANLAAAGMIPGEGASAAERQQFMNHLQTQTRSQLFLRAIFSLYSPAAPSSPSEHTTGSKPDWVFAQAGAKDLSDEYKMILNSTNGDVAQATSIWTELHPDKLVYTYAKSQSTATKSYVPATDTALTWIKNNDNFIKKYGNIAAYFLPQNGGSFSDQAYTEEIQLGLRQKLSANEFLSAVSVRGAEAQYYPIRNEFDARIAQAKESNNPALVSQLTAAKSTWSAQFRDLNPLFDEKLRNYGTANARQALGNLQQMAKDGDVPNAQAGLLNDLLVRYNAYHNYVVTHPGGDTLATRGRALANNGLNAWAQQHITGSGLAELYNAVFLQLNSNLDPIVTPSTATQSTEIATGPLPGVGG